MGNKIIITNENEEEKAYTTVTKLIDGRLFAVRIYFPEANAETMQEKIERMLHRDIVNSIRKIAA